MKNALCPICEEGHLVAGLETSEAEYRGVSRELPLHYSECDVCGSETATAEQTRTNKRAMMAFKKEVDGLLTGAAVRALREKLGISQAQAAQIFGGGPVAFSKYESDDVAQSEAMDKLLRLAAALPEAFTRLATEAGVAVSLSVPANIWQVSEWRMDTTSDTATRRQPNLRVVHITTSTIELPRKYA